MNPALFSCTLLASPVSASSDLPPGIEPVPVRAGVEVLSANRFIFRGVPLSEGPVLQPTAWLGIANADLIVWTNATLGPIDGLALNEVDLTLTMEQSWEDFVFLPSLVVYLDPRQGGGLITAELTGELGWGLGPLAIFSNHAIDFWGARAGWWSETGVQGGAGFGPGFFLEGGLGLSLANTGFNEFYMGLDRGGPQHTGAGALLGWEHGSGFAVTLLGRADVPLRDDLRSATGELPVLAWGGLSLAYRFESSLQRDPSTAQPQPREIARALHASAIPR